MKRKGCSIGHWSNFEQSETIFLNSLHVTQKLNPNVNFVGNSWKIFPIRLKFDEKFSRYTKIYTLESSSSTNSHSRNSRDSFTQMKATISHFPSTEFNFSVLKRCSASVRLRKVFLVQLKCFLCAFRKGKLRENFFLSSNIATLSPAWVMTHEYHYHLAFSSRRPLNNSAIDCSRF